MTTPKKYRKKPVTVEASLWRKDGDHDEVGLYRYPPVDPITGEISASDDAILMGQMRHSEVPERFRRATCDALMDDHGWIDTLEGGHTVCPGDYIIFAATYEEVEA